MPNFYIESSVFDPIRFSTRTTISHFIIDTWFDKGLMSRSLFDKLSGLTTSGTGRVQMSSGMYVNQPETQIGVQIRNLKALPITVNVVDDGPAPLLLGGDFLKLLLDIGVEPPSPDSPRITIEPPNKRGPESLGIRLIPESKTIDAIELERFLRAIRSIHNVAVITKSGLHQHDDWNTKESKAEAVDATVQNDFNLGSESRLNITWVESGSIWVSVSSGSKKALSWLTQLFSKTMDARLQSTIAEAASAEEAAAIQRMTRDEILRAKTWEQRKIAADHFRQTREEWHKTVLGEIDFQKKLANEIKDPVVRKAAQKNLEKAISDLAATKFLPLIEHVPSIPESERDDLNVKTRKEERE